ncbi:hypothetical protein niasHT_037552 [Heterodera trifolii]|uniref:Uncharacterized protein n=1 Tax=Heterodera trifolii TaxID=157864 RepID=A0ABD2ILX0_9BILA
MDEEGTQHQPMDGQPKKREAEGTKFGSRRKKREETSLKSSVSIIHQLNIFAEMTVRGRETPGGKRGGGGGFCTGISSLCVDRLEPEPTNVLWRVFGLCVRWDVGEKRI